MNQLPRVSIITANHNYGKWISGAILSAAKESYPVKQLVIVDDGSTDNSWEMICKITGIKDSNFNIPYQGRVMQMPVIAFRCPLPRGPSAARNIGMQLVMEQSDLFVPLDADDEYINGKITKSVQLWLTDPQSIGAVYTDYFTFSENSSLLLREFKPPFCRQLIFQNNMVHSAAMFSRAAVQAVGGYEESLRVAEDLDLWLRISERFIILHIPEALMKVRVGEHGSSQTVNKEIWQTCWQKVMQRVQERAKGNVSQQTS